MKVKNLGKRGWHNSAKNKSRASESVESRQKRLASQSLYQKEKIANESVECRQHRLANQRQYEKEKNANESVE